MKRLLALVLCLAALPAAADELRGTGDLGIVIERAGGSLQIIETSGRTALTRREGRGDLSHASAGCSRDCRYACGFGRDGGPGGRAATPPCWAQRAPVGGAPTRGRVAAARVVTT